MSYRDYMEAARSMPQNAPGTPLAQFGKSLSDMAHERAMYGLQQQQADYLYPKDLSMTPNMLSDVYNNPMPALQRAAQTGFDISKERPQQFRPVLTPDGRLVQPQGPVKTSDNGGPERDIASDGSDPLGNQRGQFEQAMSSFRDGTMAKRMGLQIDPETGRIHGPGRQVKEYYDMYDKLLQLQGNIMASAIRPAPQQGYQQLPQPHTGGGRAAPKDPRIAQAQKDMELYGKALTNPNIKAAMLGQGLTQEEVQRRYDEARQRFDNLTGGAPAKLAPKSTNEGSAPVKSSKGSTSRAEADKMIQSGSGVYVKNKSGVRVFMKAKNGKPTGEVINVE